MKTVSTSLVLLAFVAAAPAAAPLTDAPAPDTAQVLDALAKLKAQNEATIKQRRSSAYDIVKAAAASGDKAVALWKDAVKATQFDGADDETSKMRQWRDSTGEALNSKEAHAAAKLHMVWLFYTLQHHAGVSRKELLPLVIDYTNQLSAHGQTMENFGESLDKQKERAASGKGGARRDAAEDTAIKRAQEGLLNTPVSSSPVAKYLGLEDILPRGAGQNDRMARSVAKLLGAGAPKQQDDAWPMTPGDLDGIHRSIILPEYRETRDPRILEYWDFVIKRETDGVTKRGVDYEQQRFQQIRRPELLWSRAQDLREIGLKNRAILEMLAVIKANPVHPQAKEWIAEVQSLVAPSPGGGAPAAPAAR
jgi:hypothetical protein